ncbi:phosphinothricin N-acetyltransferase [Actinocatenispora thailandica]|uniref:Phosphinothricin N-acetyltransferase n=1 Tax=Actinocatenispora thailandica TaxID=227318 RepID=A0A7R7I026_9ACTN|nr:GNAT family N-acetyltransferase [Actinocatenispora thailandica]BCJ38883.1 phosphinothricin N-acetyltransferase [Actinocatenispora thailandica]
MLEPEIRPRPARLDDLPRLTEIYNHYVLTTAITFDVEPVTVEGRRGWFDEHAPKGRHRLLVADYDGVVLGYASSSQFRAKPAYETSVELSVYLAPEHTGYGAGSLLYRQLLDELDGADVHRVYAGVCLPNEASVRLHRSLGFQSVGVYREVGRKFGRYWDVQWFERGVGTP